MARGCGRRRLLLAGAYRATELTAHNVLGDVLGAMQAETECTVIRLRALGAGAIGQLVAAEAGLPVSSSLAAAIAGHTGGNPFFAREMTRHLLEERALGQDGSGPWKRASRCWRYPKECGRFPPAVSPVFPGMPDGWRCLPRVSPGRFSSRSQPWRQVSATRPHWPPSMSCWPPD